jgi:hypothetical protein
VAWHREREAVLIVYPIAGRWLTARPRRRPGRVISAQQVRTTISPDMDFWDSWLGGLFKRVRGEMYEMG